MDIVNEIATKLGVKQDQAQGIVGTVLAAVRKEAPSDVGQAIDEKVPEAKKWAPQGGGGLGGMLGGLAGGAGGGAAGILASLQRFGIDAGQLSHIAPTIMVFLRERIGHDKVEKLLGSVPFLKQGGASSR